MTTSRARVLDRAHALMTVGLVALVFLTAFESLAVTTVMPTVSRALDGGSLFALAFAGPLATGVVGMVAAGSACDRYGPALVVYAAAAVFAAGLVVCAAAPTMGVLVTGRVLQGLGGGALTVGLYAVVGRVYAAELQPAIFAAFAAAWVLPSLVGPGTAAFVSAHLGWRWVFGGVVILVALALAVVRSPLRGLSAERKDGDGPRPPLLLATGVAIAVLAVELLDDGPDAVRWLVPVAVVAAIVGVRGLLPRRTLRLGRGLPAVIATRGMFAAAFFGAEAFLPLTLQNHWGLSPGQAGLALTGAALTWAAASQWQARVRTKVDDESVLRLGALVLLAGMAALAAGVGLRLPLAVPVAGYVVAAAGMGLAYPRTSVAALRHADPARQGQTMSALSVADSMGAAIGLAVAGVLVGAAHDAGLARPELPAFALGMLAAAAAVAAAVRSREAQAAVVVNCPAPLPASHSCQDRS